VDEGRRRSLSTEEEEEEEEEEGIVGEETFTTKDSEAWAM
jgi:hypothetical protein